MIYQSERPQNFDSFIGQEYVVDNIRRQSMKDQWFNVYILHGQYGSGKTSLARVIALAANCEHKDEHGNPCLECSSCREILSEGMDYREIDGAANSSVENIRNLKEYVSYLPTRLRKKIVIIDEVHMLSKSAFNCALKMLEEPPEYMLFILCTTELADIPYTVRSRAASYSFQRIPQEKIKEAMIQAAENHKISIDEGAAGLLAHYSDGSMRNAYVLLEQAGVGESHISENTCRQLLGIADEEMVCQVLESILERNLPKFIQYLDQMEQKGKNFSLLAADLQQSIADLTLASCSCAGRIAGTKLYQDGICALTNRFPLEYFSVIFEPFRDLRIRTKGGNKYEFMLFILSAFQVLNEAGTQQKIALLNDRLAEIERQWKSGIKPVVLEDSSMQEELSALSVEEQTKQEEEDWEEQNSYEEEGFMSSDHDEVPFEEDHANTDRNDMYMFAAFEDGMDEIFSEMNEQRLQEYDSPKAENFPENMPIEKEISVPVEQKETKEEVLDQKETKSEGISKDEVEAMILRDPLLSMRYRMSGSIKQNENGEIHIVTKDKGLQMQLLLFITKNQLKKMSVEYIGQGSM